MGLVSGLPLWLVKKSGSVSVTGWVYTLGSGGLILLISYHMIPKHYQEDTPRTKLRVFSQHYWV